MGDRKRSIYFYTGYAAAAASTARCDRETGATFTEDDKDRSLPSVAPVVLASIGGFSRAELKEPISHRDGLLKIGYALSEAYGEYSNLKQAAALASKGKWMENQLPAITTVTSTVKGIEINNTGRKLEIELASFALKGVSRVETGDQPVITVVPNIVGLKIDGKSLNVKFVGRDFLNTGSLNDCLRQFKDDEKFAARYAGHFFSGDQPWAPLETKLKRLPSKSFLVATVVDSISWTDPKDQAPGVKPVGRNALYIEGIGTLILGTLRMRPNSKAITMVRVQLGSRIGGEDEASSGGVSAGGWPP